MANQTGGQLAVGMGMQLERHGEGSVHKVYAISLLGYAAGRSLIIAINDSKQSIMDFTPGDEFTLRFAYDGQVHAFDTTVLAVVLQPYHHLHLRFPEAMAALTLRRTPRYPVDLPVMRLSIREGVKDYDVTMADISVQGACLVCDQALGREGEHFSIDIPLPGSTDLITLPCHIRYVRQENGSQQAPYFHGVEFGELDDDAQIFLSGYIEELAQHMHLQD